MAVSDSNGSFRQCLLDLIDRSGVSDRRLSLLPSGNPDTVRNMRRGSPPAGLARGPLPRPQLPA